MGGNIAAKMTAEEAEASLRKWLGSRVVDLQVRILGGGVTLQGIAYSYHAKQLAQHAAMRIFDLPVLTNEIEVRLRLFPMVSEKRDGN